MSCFVLDLGGSREIDLCPHLQINPETHMHFDNLFKVSKREAVREMSQITKPNNTLCKHCQQEKKTKTRFKSKEYSTTRPLKIVHIDLVGPTTTKGLKGEK
jgi:hypothetical protein